MEINDPRIEAYFNFELSPEETSAFLEEAKQHPQIWKEIQFKQWIIDGIQDEGRIELKEFIGNRLAEEREESTGKFWYAAAAIAITLVVGFGIAWPYLNKTNLSSENRIVSLDSTTSIVSEEPQQTTPHGNPTITDSTQALAQQIPVIVENADDKLLAMDEANPDAEGFVDKQALDVGDFNSPLQSAEGKSSRSVERATALPPKESGAMGAAKFNEELVTITSFWVKPIQLNYKTKELLADNIENNKNRKSKLPAHMNNQPTSAMQVEAVPLSNSADTINRSVAKAVRVDNKFKIVLTRSSSGVPQGLTSSSITPEGTNYTLLLNNFGDANALVYRLGTAYYLGIDNLFYSISLNSQSPWTPKQVTDKSILQQLNP